MVIRLAAVLFVGMLSSVSVVWGADAVAVEKGPARIFEHSSINICRWKTYTSEKYGFEMSYPPDFAEREEIPLTVIQGAVVRLSLVNRGYYDGTNLVEASLFVGVTPKGECFSRWLGDTPSNSSGNEGLSDKRDIAGVTFTRTSFWEGAVGNQYGLITYSATHAGNCYRLALFIHSINIQVYDPGSVSEFDRASVMRLFDQVISTFRFLK